MRTAGLRAAALTAALALAAVPPALAAGTPAGTPITNQASVAYADANGNPLSALSNVVTTIVSQVASVTVAPDNAAAAVPGDTLYYAHVVTNGGNGPDTIDLASVSGTGWAVALFLDADASGTFTPGDIPLADSDGDTIPDTGLLIADGSVNILVSVTVPAGVASGTIDTTFVTGTSSFNAAVSDSAVDVTSIDAPGLSVLKSVGPAGPQPPGATLTYSMVVTNNGTGAASSVVLTDPIPASTTFVPASITLNGVAKTDISGDDEADYNVTTPGAITVDVGSLAPGASVTITFQVAIL